MVRKRDILIGGAAKPQTPCEETESAIYLPGRTRHGARVDQTRLRSSVGNAHRNFRALHAKVSIDQQTIVVHDGMGEEVVWLCASQLLQLSRPALTCEEILAELLG